MRRRALGSILLALVLLGVLFRGTLVAYGKSTLFITEVFPAIGVKPLQLMSAPPLHSRITISTSRGTVVGDLFLPEARWGEVAARSAPAVILAQGVRTLQKDRGPLLDLGRTLARLGLVVLWPRSEALDQGLPVTEEPSTFVAAYQYLENVAIVDSTRISFVGFSMGSSIAFVAAADEDIADQVRALVVFGGYFDIFDYLTSMLTQTAVCDGQVIYWHVDPYAADIMREILEQKGSQAITGAFGAANRQEAEAILRAAPPSELEDLRRINPRERVDRFRARIFILHDEGDAYVPYCEAIRMKEALSPGVPSTYLLLHLFQHISPAGAITPDTVADFGRLFLFVSAVFESL